MGIKEEKKVEILNAAMNVFAQSGFDGAKIEEIARVAGIGKGTVYEYFESKKQLFEAMVEYGTEVYIERLVLILAKGKDVREKLILFSEFQAAFMVNHLDMIQSVQTHVLSRELRNWLLTQKLSIKKVFEDVVEVGMHEGELRSDLDKDIATHCIFGTIAHYSPSQIFLEGKKPHEINHEAVVDTVLRGLI